MRTAQQADRFQEGEASPSSARPIPCIQLWWSGTRVGIILLSNARAACLIGSIKGNVHSTGAACALGEMDFCETLIILAGLERILRQNRRAF